MRYNREMAVRYAHQWAYKRNPIYYNFDSIGGDCTNYVSQCLFSGCKVMNYTRDIGWYYRSLNDRAAAWTSVEYLFKFLLSNSGRGPYAKVRSIDQAEIGDVIQLSFNGLFFSHTLFVISITPNEILIASHSEDADYRPLASYSFVTARLLHIIDVRN